MSCREQSRCFDFLLGSWAVHHRKLRDRLRACNEWYEFPGTLEVRSMLGGAGNFDRNELFDPGGFYEASSLRLFNSRTNQWLIYWLDARAPLLEHPVVGSFDATKVTFFNEEELRGRLVRVRTTYEPLSPSTAEWTQAFSPDGGESWEVNWVMEFTRVSSSSGVEADV